MPDDARQFDLELHRLTDRLRGRSPSWFLAAGREQPLRTLAGRLAGLAVTAGGGAPDGAAPPRLGVHALADQLTVLGAELSAAPGVEQVAGEAVGAVRTTARALGP